MLALCMPQRRPRPLLGWATGAFNWLLLAVAVVAPPSCWDGGFTAQYCCRGRAGRQECWDSRHTFEKCCAEYKNHTYPFNDLLWGRRQHGFVDPRRFPPSGDIAGSHLRCLLEMQATGVWQEKECQKFTSLVDEAVARGTPGSETRAQYFGTHYRLLLRSLPYISFVTPVFDAFYKARSFPREFWGRDDFALFEAAFNSLLTTGHCAVDGGANIGGYTQMMALAVGGSGEVHSFEPFRVTFQILNANVVLGGLQNVWTYQKALSNRNGAKTQAYGTDILDPGQQMIWNSLVIARETTVEWDHGGSWLAEPSELEQLEHVTLDSLNLPRVDFIKSDVEGMEGHLLLGALGTLQKFWPSILVEIKGFQRQAIHTLLVSELGYKCHSALTTNPSDFFCWHPRRLELYPGPGERRRIFETLELLTTDKAFNYCSACKKREAAAIELGSQGAGGSLREQSAVKVQARRKVATGKAAPAATATTTTPDVTATSTYAAPTTAPTTTTQDTTTTSTYATTTAASPQSTTVPVTSVAMPQSSAASSTTTRPENTMAPTPALSTAAACADQNEFCADWASYGSCVDNPKYMASTCPIACGFC